MPGVRAITCDSGLTLRSQGSLQRFAGQADTLVVSGGCGHDAPARFRRTQQRT